MCCHISSWICVRCQAAQDKRNRALSILLDFLSDQCLSIRKNYDGKQTIVSYISVERSFLVTFSCVDPSVTLSLWKFSHCVTFLSNNLGRWVLGVVETDLGPSSVYTNNICRKTYDIFPTENLLPFNVSFQIVFTFNDILKKLKRFLIKINLKDN